MGLKNPSESADSKNANSPKLQNAPKKVIKKRKA
jgi:hypothetical protein